MFKQLFRTSKGSLFKSLIKPQITAFAEGKSTLKTYSITGKTDENLRLKVKGSEMSEVCFENALEANLASLVSCELHTLKFWAGTRNIKITAFDVKEAHCVIDTRGFGGTPGVPPRFLEVSGTIEVDGNLTEKQLHELHEKVSKSCPIYDLYQAAGVKMDIKWVKKA